MKQGLKRDYRSSTLYRHKKWREVGEGVGLYLRPDRNKQRVEEKGVNSRLGNLKNVMLF